MGGPVEPERDLEELSDASVDSGPESPTPTNLPPRDRITRGRSSARLLQPTIQSSLRSMLPVDLPAALAVPVERGGRAACSGGPAMNQYQHLV
jgi:hypothetical protein